MPETFPRNENSQEPEFHLVALELLNDLHKRYAATLKKDEKEIQANVAIGAATDDMSKEWFALSIPEGDPALPVACDQLLFMPKQPEDATYTALLLKFPVLSPSIKQYLRLPEGFQYWNDVVVEIIRKDGCFERYLFNAQGIEAYDDADSLDASVHENEPDNADLYSVHQEEAEEERGRINWLPLIPRPKAKEKPTLTVAELKKMLDSSTQKRQSGSR